MVGRFQGQKAIRIRDLYFDALDSVMEDYGIEPLRRRPDHVVDSDANFPEVVQHTDWFLRRNAMLRYPLKYREHYRYDRYDKALASVWFPWPGEAPSLQKTHVDIGCGFGLFSWVFLDWPRDSEMQIESYGLDHSQEMLRFAREMRDRLDHHLPYNLAQSLCYTHDVDVLLQGLTQNYRPDTDYIITFGHVLAQTHDNHDAILDFTKVLAHVLELMDAESNCYLVAVDAHSHDDEFVAGWRLLLDRAACTGIWHNEISVSPSHHATRIARLRPTGR